MQKDTQRTVESTRQEAPEHSQRRTENQKHLHQSTISSDWREHPEVVVNEAISAALAEAEPSDSIDALLSYIGRSMSADRVYIFEFADEDTLYNSYEWCAEGVSAQIGNLSHTPLSIYESTWMPRFRAHEPVLIADVEASAAEDPTVADILRPQGITSLVAIPLFLEGAFVGFIGIDNPAQRAMEGVVAFLETLANFTSTLLRHRNNVQRLFNLSSHDRVSGAFDTLYLLDQLERARKTGVLAPAEGSDLSDIGDIGNLSVVYCNLVQFKEYNSAFGMDEGNRCLTDVGKALRDAFGTRCVSRFSADHFIVFYGGDDLWNRIDDAHQRVLGLRSSFKLWLVAGVCAPDASQKLSTAVDLAKVACDQIPKDGQSYTCFYTGKIEEELERKKYLQDHIEQAVEEGWLQVYYQPVIRTLTGRLAGVEALSRWNDPVYGVVSPGVFVPALEEKHLSWRLLSHVIDSVCESLSNRCHKGLPVVPVSVNVSRTDFESCLPFEVIQDAVQRHDIPPSLICVEITESVAMGDPEGIEAVVEQFHSAGYEVWMDDFGSAYSSLNTLKDFSFGKLKLDMLFMHNFNDRARDIISSIIAMAKKLGVHTLAEGVETREQVDFLIDAGCEEIQGFYFSEPLPLGKVIEFADSKPPENRAQRDLYNELGLVRIQANDACGFIFCRGSSFHMLYGNERLRKSLRRGGVVTPERADELLNTPTGRFAQVFRALADRALKTHLTEAVPFTFNGRKFQMALRVVAQSSAGIVLLASLQDVSAPTAAFEFRGEEPRQGADRALASWTPALLREKPDASESPVAPGLASGRAVEDSELLDLSLSRKAADEFKRGFSVPSSDVASTSMAIRHSQSDALETFSALSSIFVTLVNADFRTWLVQPIKIARVTEDYLSGEYVDYDTVAEKFLENSVSESYRDAVRRFMDRSSVVDRLSEYGTITIDYIGAKLGWCRLFLIPIETSDDGVVTKALFAARDINDEKAEERRMNYDITHDPLTKALNRNGLRQAISMIRGYTGSVAYAIFDVDNFKVFNDTHGHEKGDELLMAVARLLIDSFDATDYVARIGGDEFVILMTHYNRDDDGAAIRARVAKVNARLAGELDMHVSDASSVQNEQVAKAMALDKVSLSAGIVISRDGYRDDLYTMADRLLYDEKASGKGGSRVRIVEGPQV